MSDDSTKTTDFVIEHGKARTTLAGALLNLHRAIYELEAVSSALARALDTQRDTIPAPAPTEEGGS